VNQHILPVPDYCVTTQTFDEHEAAARRNGWCTRPGNCPSGIYYYGGLDKAPTWADINRDIPVCASADFKSIEYADWDRKGKGPGGGYGFYVKGITPDREEVITAHLATIPMVKAGDKDIPAGTQLGWMGSTGNSSSKHIHWEIRVNGIPVDPEKKLSTVIVQPPVVVEPVINGDYPGAAVIEIEDWEFELASDWLNLRNGPGTQMRGYQVVGKIEGQGIEVKGKRLVIWEGWIEIGDGKYCALVNQGEVYLVRK